MNVWRLAAGSTSLAGLTLEAAQAPTPKSGEVLVRLRACSLNYRDQMIVQGQYGGGPLNAAVTPLSDGTGEVVEVGEGVTEFKTGDRVAGTFFQNWMDHFAAWVKKQVG